MKHRFSIEDINNTLYHYYNENVAEYWRLFNSADRRLRVFGMQVYNLVDKSIGKIDAFGKGMREAGQKSANTFRTFADKPEKEYAEKKFSKTELIKKPFQAKRKLLSGILNCVDAAIEKTEQLAADVIQYQTDKTERETGNIGNVETVNPVELASVSEPEFRRLLRYTSSKRRKRIKRQRMRL